MNSSKKETFHHVPVPMLSLFLLNNNRENAREENNLSFLSLPVNSREPELNARMMCPPDSDRNILSAIAKDIPINNSVSVFSQSPIHLLFTSFTTEGERDRDECAVPFSIIPDQTPSNIYSKPLSFEIIQDAINWFSVGNANYMFPYDVNIEKDPHKKLDMAFAYLINDVMTDEKALVDCNDIEVLTIFIKNHKWPKNVTLPKKDALILTKRQFIHDNVAWMIRIAASPLDGMHRTIGSKICLQGLISSEMNEDLKELIRNYSSKPIHIESESQVPIVCHLPAEVTRDVCEGFHKVSIRLQNNADYLTSHGVFMYLGLILKETQKAQKSFTTKRSDATQGPDHWLLTQLDFLMRIDTKRNTLQIQQTPNMNGNPEDSDNATFIVNGVDQTLITDMFLRFAKIILSNNTKSSPQEPKPIRKGGRAVPPPGVRRDQNNSDSGRLVSTETCVSVDEKEKLDEYWRIMWNHKTMSRNTVNEKPISMGDRKSVV